ncbi:MAG: MaoC family dehydratase [Acidobacteriota bacterium]
MAAHTVDLAGLRDLVGVPLTSPIWREVTQEAVDDFARATGDRQWIHTDPARARLESPFGRTIAHGYLSLSLVPALLFETLEVTGASLVINYGTNRVRFPAPVPVGSRVRLVARISGVEEVPGGLQVTLGATVEIEGSPKPAMAAELLYRYLA